MWWIQLLLTCAAIYPVLSMPRVYNIIPNENSTSTCSDESFRFCLTLQQLAKHITNDSDVCSENSFSVSLIFAPGKHFLVGGIELNNTANIVLKGQIRENSQTKPQISCHEKRCFTFRNSTNIHIENLVFADCFSEDSDGGAFLISRVETVNITQCSFVNNFIRKRGGAVRLQLIESVHVQYTSFINNSAICHPLNTFSYLGSVYCLQSCISSSGAISALNVSSFIIKDSLFDGNIATCFNGAVLMSLSNAEIFNSKFVRNRAESFAGIGGGLYIDSSNVQISECTFEQNIVESNRAASSVGGGISASYSMVRIFNSSFLKNVAGFQGGAAYFADTNLLIEDTLFSKNTAGAGGGMAVVSSSQESVISNCSFSNNGASSRGGAVSLLLTGVPNCTFSCNHFLMTPSTPKPLVSFTHSIFKNNRGYAGGAINSINGVFSVTNCEFHENRATLGGAITSDSSIAYFQENKFNKSESLLGGVFYMDRGIALSIGNVYMYNVGSGGGGAIIMFSSTLTSRNDRYISNKATQNGGALSAQFSSVLTYHCIYSSNSALRDGGAVFVINGTCDSSSTLYEANVASRNGGALSLTRSQTSIKGDSFQHNVAAIGEGAAIFQADSSIIQLHNTTFAENQAMAASEIYSLVLLNAQGSCGNLTFSSNIGSMYLFNTMLSFSGQVIFINNTGLTGGAITLAQSSAEFDATSEVIILGNIAAYGGGVFLSLSTLMISTSYLKVSSNTATVSGGGITGYQSRITVTINDTSQSVLFANNIGKEEGGALLLIATTLTILHGFVDFEDNLALRGGAVALSSGSKIYVQKTAQEMMDNLTVKLNFSNNTAEYGGALYVTDNSNTGVLCQQSVINRVSSLSTEECFIQTLRLYYDPGNRFFRQFNYWNFFFYSNKGSISGNDIFGGLLDRCQISTLSEINNFSPFFYGVNGFEYLKTIAQFQIGIDYNQLSDPFSPKIITATIKSEHFKNLVSSHPVQLCFCVNNTHNCSYQWPRIFAKRGEAFSLRAIAVDQVENQVNGTIVASVISNGTRIEVGQSRQVSSRVCTELTYSVFSTEPNATLELYPDGPCSDKGISSKLVNITFLPCDCPNGLQPAPLDNECKCECDSSINKYLSSCQLIRSSFEVVRVNKENWIQYTNVGNMTGFQFQNCPSDYCLAEPANLSVDLPLNVDKQCANNRSGIMCGECEDGLSLVFGSSRCVQCNNNYLALLVAFAFAGIALVAFILILNMTVEVGTIHGLILYANIVKANKSVLLPPDTVLHFFISWLNLDLGIETCFYDGMDSNAKVLLQLVFPLYIILLAALILLASRYWGWFAGLIGRKNPVATLCTLFLLLYSKLFQLILSSVQYTSLTYPDGSSNLLWLYNPNILHFSPSRIPFFLISILIIFLLTAYTLLLFFGQWLKHIEKKKFCGLFRSRGYKAFMEAYYAPFAINHHYWIGVLLFTRIIHHLITSTVDESIHLLVVSCIVSILLILNILLSELYKNWKVGFLETSFFINLLMFSVSSFYTSSTSGDQVALANTSVLIAFLTFWGIVLYHIFMHFAKNLKTCSKLTIAFRKYLQLFKQKFNSQNRSDTSFEEVPTQEHMLPDTGSVSFTPPPVTRTLVTLEDAECVNQA